MAANKMTYRQVIREIAVDHYGYVTTKMAREVGVPAVELPKLAARGGLVNIAYGLYRVADIPVTPYDKFAEALFRVGEGACLHGESVLAFLGLADVNPKRINVALNRRARPSLPAFVRLTWVKDKVRTTLYEALMSQPVADAIVECQERIETSHLLEAAAQARNEGLLTTGEWKQVTARLRF